MAVIMLELPSELEAPFRDDAERERIPLSEVVSRRLREAELMRRVFPYFPPTETRRMRSLVRKRESGTITALESEALTHLAHQREIGNAQRLMDLAELSKLRGIPLRRLMDELNIRPFRMG